MLFYTTQHGDGLCEVQQNVQLPICLRLAKGTTSNDLGVGPEEIEKKIISEAHLREKINFERYSLGKINFERLCRRKIFYTEGVPGTK